MRFQIRCDVNQFARHNYRIPARHRVAQPGFAHDIGSASGSFAIAS
jgi:hypothetical protein